MLETTENHPNPVVTPRRAPALPLVPLNYEEEEELTPEQRIKLIAELETRMKEAAKQFEFEKAAQFRDRIKELRTRVLYEESPVSRTGSDG